MKHQTAATALIIILMACVGSFLIVVVSAAPGDVDTTFNGTGHARLGFGQGRDEAAAVTLQADGKIVVAGTTDGLFRKVTVLRYNADGSPDTTFGGLGTGRVQNPLGSSGGFGRAVKMQQDNKIVVAGLAITGNAGDFGILRLKADGSPDDTFGNFGIVTTPIGTGGDEASALVIQADGKIVAGGFTANGTHTDFALVRYNSDGSLDSSFGSGGKVTTQVGAAGSAAVSGLAIQSDGKILAAGSATNGVWKDFALVRYNANGSVDTPFALSGGVLTGFGPDTNDEAAAVAIQTGNAVTPDKIVLAGTSDFSFALARYDLTGALDPTFGSGGKVVTPFSPGQDQGAALVIQGTGNQLRKILVAGQTTTGIETEIAVARYNADGSLDTSFGSGGKTTAGVVPNSKGKAIALQAGNKVVVAGDTIIAGFPDFEVARFNSDGSLDISFDNDGKRIDDGDQLAQANAVAIQADEKIVVAGYCVSGIFYEFAVARYNPDGSLDTSFDGDGKVITSVGTKDDQARAVAIQSDGKIVVAGFSIVGSASHFAVVRYNANGSLDTSFGTAGKVVTAVGTIDSAMGVAIQSDGKIVLGGSVQLPNGNLSFALVRYNSNGSPDNSFGSGGKVTTPVGTFDIGTAVAVQPNGRILLAGYTNLGGSNPFVIVRYNSNGTLDTSFGGSGIVTTAFSPGANGNALALQADGRIVVGGAVLGGGIALARYNANGSLDTLFDGDGKVVMDDVSGIAGVYGLAIQSDGKIVAAGFNDSPISFADFAAVRFNTNGSIDTSYGTNGRVIVDLGNRDQDGAAAIALDSSGRAVLVGSANNYFMTVRLDGGPVATPTPTPSPTPTASPTPTPTPTPTPMTIQFSASNYPVGEGSPSVDISITRFGNTTGAASVNFTTSDLAAAQNCNVLTGTASSRCDYETSIRTIQFAGGETSKTISVFIIDDSYLEGPETFNVVLSNPSGAALGSPATATVTITDNDIANGPNPIDTAGFFVRLHYLDFLNREPDPSGFNFWTNEINSCGANQQCLALKRINVSAAFYISIEFQQTGYLVHRIYKTSFGDASGTSTLGGAHQLAVPIVRLNEFLPDTQKIGRGVIVGQPGFELVLDANKQAFTAEFVQRSRFAATFPATMIPSQFVDALFANGGVTPSPTDRQAAIDEFGGAGTSADLAARGRALRRVAENGTLAQQEFNRAFVLMQFFGYLRRNPNDPQDTDYTGYDFWLTKLNQFNGNFVNAEMVKAFITSGEYRQRFGP